jgi:hypothetical protein
MLTTPAARRRACEAAAVALLLSAHAWLLVGQIGNHSPASDEPIHIASGYRLWTTGQSVDTTHPPLARYLLTAPLLALRPDPFADDVSFIQPAHTYPQRFLLHNRISMAAILWATRLAAVAVSLALGVVTWLWSRRLWGAAGGVLTLALYAFSPAVLADGPVAGNDVAAALAEVLALWAFRVYLGRPGPRTLALFGLGFAAAQATKYTSVLLIPICAALYLVKRALEARRASPRTAPRVGAAARDAVLVAAGTALLVWGLYRFEAVAITADPQLAANPAGAMVKKLLARLPGWVGTVPVPGYSFLKGFALQTFHAGNQKVWTGGVNHQFLFGRNAPNGWWYYFPAAMAVKTPLAVLALLGWLAVGSARARRAPQPLSADRFDVWAVALPAAGWVLCCMAITINIGVRYVLLAYPLLFVLLGGLPLGRAPARPLPRNPKRVPNLPRWATAAKPPSPYALLVAALVAWQAAGAVGAYPHVHAYFNEAAGGPRGGWRYLNNSSIDWGQDLAELGRYLERERPASLPYLDYFGSIRPEDLGITYRPLPKTPEALRAVAGTVIVSETNLTAQGPYDPLYRRLRSMPSVAQIGYTIFVYSVPPAP